METAAGGAAGQGRRPEGMPQAFRGSRTQAGGDRWPSFALDHCEKGH
jgi:hypothetical protein